MGDTLLVSVRGGRTSDECTMMLLLQADIDRLCLKLNVATLSTFYDGSVMAAHYLDELEGEELGDAQETHPEAFAETWHDPGPALEAVRTIVERLEQRPEDLDFQPDASRAHWPADLMDELRDSVAILEEAVAKGQQFRFLLMP